jgi:hypothetical protein
MDKKPETDMAMGSTRFGIPSGHNRHDATPFFISVMRASLDRQDQTFERVVDGPLVAGRSPMQFS